MKDIATERIRNVGIVGHGGTGKTTFVEGALFATGTTNRFGSVDEGNTHSDYNPEEIERKISISSALLHVEWNGHKINFIDTPGYSDFQGEVKGALRAIDMAVVLVKAQTGIEVGTEQVWAYADELNLARVIVINELDRENADYARVIGQIKDRFGKAVVPVQIPINEGNPNFHSMVDVRRMKLLDFVGSDKGESKQSEIPPELLEQAKKMRNVLIEAVAETSDALMEKYFDAGDLTDDEIKQGFRKGVIAGSIVPVMCMSAAKNVGVRELMELIVDSGPSPLDRPEEQGLHPSNGTEEVRKADRSAAFSALIFKTIEELHVGELSFFRVFSGKVKAGDDVYNSVRKTPERMGQIFFLNGKEKIPASEVIAGDLAAVVKLKDAHTNNTLCDKNNPIVLKEIQFPAPVIRSGIVPKNKGDEEKIGQGLHTLHEEDPTFIVQVDPELGQTIISGQGELHLGVVTKKLKDRFNVEVDLVEPKIPYRETIKGRVDDIQGKYKKQSGGRGQYGDVHLKIEPLERGKGFEFVNAIVGGVVPGKYIPAVEKGCVETLKNGILAGYPVVDIKITLHYGSYHNVDSSEMAFKIAASMAFKKGFMECKPVLLEPIYEIEIRCPGENMGDVMGDISSRRGKILGMDAEGVFEVIRCAVPLAELYRYSTVLRSITSGRGIHKRKFSNYEEVPADVAKKIVEAYQASKEQH